MSNVTLFGFPRSTFVKVVGLILTAKGVPYTFHDTEDEMYLPIHLQSPHTARASQRARWLGGTAFAAVSSKRSGT